MESPPVFSIIIPAFMAAEYLGGAIQSVLDQTFPDFEVIVVNDASPDGTASVVKRFVDPRVKYLVHETNRGLPATRNTGIRASTGKYIAFLDHDDQFLPEKLACHYSFLEQHPEVGATYNSRFEVGQSIDDVRALWPAPAKAELSDLVLGYPFSPSDLVVRREWLLEIGLLDEGNTFHGEDLNTNCRLALAGCRYAPIDQVLNYRRNHPARIRKNLDASLRNVFRNLELVFNDPRCPEQVVRLRSLAYANNYLVWAYLALAQEETERGREYLRNALELDHGLMLNDGRALMDSLVFNCAYDDRGPLTEAVRTIFRQLPEEAGAVSGEQERVVGRALVVRAVQDLIWGRREQGMARFAEAEKLEAGIDPLFLQMITHQLLAYEKALGEERILSSLEEIGPCLNKLGNGSGDRLAGSYLINCAFGKFHAGIYQNVSALVLAALRKDPSHLANRGVISMFVHSLRGIGT